MKKQLLTALLLAGGITAMTAQNPLIKEVDTKSHKVEHQSALVNNIFPKSLELKSVPSIKTSMQNLHMSRAVVTPKASILAMYAPPFGSYFTGVTKEGWYSSPQINTPAYCEPVFDNYSTENASYTWTVTMNGEKEELEMDDNNSGIGIPFFGGIETPILKVSKGGSSAQYQLGQATKDKKGYWASGTDITFLSMADPSGDAKNGANVFVYITEDERGFDTGQEFMETGKTLTGFLSLFQQPMGDLYTRGMYMLVFSPTKKNPIPKGESIELILSKLNEDGGIGNEIIKATATAEDATAVGTAGFYYIVFKFTNDANEPIHLVLGDSNLAAEITGVEDLDFTMMFGTAGGFPGYSYAILEDGDLSSLYYDDGKTPMASFHIGFIGAFPYAKVMEETTKVTIPNEGGMGTTTEIDGVKYNDVVLLTSISTEDVFGNNNYTIISSPDWVTKIEFSDQNFEKGSMSIFVTGTALPEGETGRAGQIKLDICGVPVTFDVVQGNTVGIQNNAKVTTNAVCNGDNIILTYPENVTSVTIVNVAGQAIANYDLPANGQFTIPAAGFNKGLYLVKFNNNQTVKVIK